MDGADQPRLARIGMVARWKPVHRGHAAVLEALVARADLALIGIGSANRHDADNPFTAAESADMIRLALGGRRNYALMEVPDLGHGPRWRAMVQDLFGPLDLYVTANPYVRELMSEVYPVVHPVALVDPARRVRVDGTMVRQAMARGEDWRALVPDEVARYLEDRGLVERLRREHGAQLVARDRAG